MSKKTRNLVYLRDLTAWPWAPFIIYSIARKKMPDGTWKRGIKMEEIAEASGLSWRHCMRIAAKLTWEDEKQSVIDAFCKGCGFSFFHTAEQLRYLKRLFRAGDAAFPNLSPCRRTYLNRRCAEYLKLKGKKSE